MNKKTFDKKSNEIIKNYDCKKDGYLDNTFSLDTFLGKLEFRFDASPKIKVYSVFMQFQESEKFNIDSFYATFSKYEVINPYSFKWNIHNSDPEYILNEFEERLSNLEHLSKK